MYMNSLSCGSERAAILWSQYKWKSPSASVLTGPSYPRRQTSLWASVTSTMNSSVHTHLPLHSHSRSKIPADGGVIKHRVGGWLLRKHEVLQNWLDKKIAYVEHPSRRDLPSHAVIVDFRHFIETNPVVYMDFHQMFEQVPTKPPYNNYPTGKPQVHDYKLMLRLFNHIIQTAPAYEAVTSLDSPSTLSWIGPWEPPLAWPCSRGPTDEGWFGRPASVAMPHFAETFVCDPLTPYYGFKSWDDFTRQFRDGAGPIPYHDDDRVINSACESTVYRINQLTKETDRFWLKGQPYSLAHMLASEERAKHYAGGTVYQAFLSATKYHRWHSPVNGRIVGVTVVPGTYYAESLYEGFPDPDAAGPNLSQAFITSVAARAIVYIESKNRDIGTLAFIAVGMAEVSTCEVTVKEGDEVAKGEQLGMFHFGGSTHCLVFGPRTKVSFDSEISPNTDVKLNAPIATVSAA
ncbi:hypothetical protein BV20DRAFT_1048950 [Pilatotrama ljubarskyi]|nr:hypothetical protein BV20DRAFT_1048950 [Pilatotrama ljubarskyi]